MTSSSYQALRIIIKDTLKKFSTRRKMISSMDFYKRVPGEQVLCLSITINGDKLCGSMLINANPYYFYLYWSALIKSDKLWGQCRKSYHTLIHIYQHYALICHVLNSVEIDMKRRKTRAWEVCLPWWNMPHISALSSDSSGQSMCPSHFCCLYRQVPVFTQYQGL